MCRKIHPCPYVSAYIVDTYFFFRFCDFMNDRGTHDYVNLLLKTLILKLFII